MFSIGLLLTAAAIAIICVARMYNENIRHHEVRIVNYVWDLTTGHESSRVSWPKSVTDDIWFIEGPTSFEVRIPGGESAKYVAIKSQIRRERGKITSISMGFPSESLDATCERARLLIREWHIPNQEKLETWYQKRRKDRGDGADVNWCQLARKGAQPVIGLDVRQDFSEPDTWYVRIIIAFSD